MFQLDLKSRTSIYEQIVDNIKELILAGVLSVEDKLLLFANFPKC